MQYQEFVNQVNERIRAGYPGEAEYAIKATLATLGEHLAGKRAEDLGARLPAELQAQLASGNYAEAAKDFSPVEFHRRVAERGRVSPAEDGAGHAQATGQAVLTVLSEAVGGKEFGDVLRRLSFREPAPLSNA